MDKNAIKKYAVWARRELIERVAKKAQQYGIEENADMDANADSINGILLTPSEKKERQALISQIRDKGYEQVMEEVAYTWFNRFSALRFMEVNGYLPTHVRVFTDDENNFKPQILTEAIHLELDGLDMEKVYELKDADKTDELYKYLLITQCNALNAILPGMFQKIADYTELLLPDNLLREGSAIEQMITLIPEEDWKDAVQIIGWLYQYYNSEKKDEVFAALKKNVKITKENIPAATQLFTPDWIVRYMVENSLGRLWVEGHPNDKLKAGWKYYLDEAEQESDVQVQLDKIREDYKTLKPEEIKCIDPCSGSGHILAYMFDVLMQIYEAYGYTSREAVASIVENNIYGLDIDERATQLANFAVMMKARQYDHRFFSRKDDEGKLAIPQPNVYVICESNHISKECLDYFANGDAKLSREIHTLVDEMHDAKEYGSILNITAYDYDAMMTRFNEIEHESVMSLYSIDVTNDLYPIVRCASIMAIKYEIVVTNPPYAGHRNLDSKMFDYLYKYYPEGKMDLFPAFISKNIKMCKKNGYIGMMTPFVWLYLSTYETLRKIIIDSTSIQNYLQPEESSFKDAAVSICAFVMQKHRINYNGNYVKLSDYQDPNIQADLVQKAKNNHHCSYMHHIEMEKFSDFPNERFIYWLGNDATKCFSEKTVLDDVCSPRTGMLTTNNDMFLRLWFEVNETKIGYGCHDAEEAVLSKRKWFPYNKGGGFKKWYGNYEYVVNFENDGKTICDYIDNNPTAKVKSSGRVTNRQYYYKKSITWSDICGSTFAARYCPNGFIFDIKGSSAFVSEEKYNYIISFLNSKVNTTLLNALNPSITTQVGDLKQLPFVWNDNYATEINALSQECIDCGIVDWDSFEVSWDFQRNPLVGTNGTLASAYNVWNENSNDRFNIVKENEEKINQIFIDIYGLGEELSAKVEEKNITIRKADLSRDIKCFISYAVGCMFGRYSLDKEGLIFAGGIWDENNYRTFEADRDNIIPICSDEYFEDDITGRFTKFVEAVYGKDTLQENLQFVADALGGKGTPIEVIRNYFTSDFYNDHCKMYQKRPIYWLFDSGKKGGFKALIYMHRYQQDTIARMRTDYVHEQQGRYRTEISDLETRIAGASTSERVKLNKELSILQDRATEIREYEEKIHHLADQMIRIDLDDGVKNNYAIFQDILAKIK
ncbi:MAG: BREX-1 system adenine-specific DNA-methyltransferase PglX [Lachnospiraceae bacterium]|nr:BREX-1 system adenine-specific DNA-methyltransferase PglX [Lachnospiraceae bacterium]